MEKKIDDYYRVLIPKEFRDQLNLTKGDPIKLTCEDNKIILTKIENVPEFILEDQKYEIESVKDIPLDKNQPDKSRLQEMIESLPYGNKYWENGILKTKVDESIQENTESEETEDSSIRICPLCKGKVEPDRKLMVNDEVICKACSLELREQLKRDAAYYKRLNTLDVNR